ncbi:MAG TPA: hypothetical protein VGY55_00345 [Pirellulales bacterium]|nr:hypothetical protein [Pirellulales bacterium]
MKRRKLFVDPKVQAAFLARIFVYWFLCLVASGIVLALRMFLVGPLNVVLHPLAEFWSQFGPAVCVSALMLPILMFDCLRLTNRLAGPMYRVRCEMRALAMGNPANSVHLRSGDFWTEFAEEYNAVRQRIILMEEGSKRRPVEVPAELATQHQQAIREPSAERGAVPLCSATIPAPTPASAFEQCVTMQD